MRVLSFRNLRIAALLLILAAVWIHNRDQALHARSWHLPLPVTIFPINPTAAPQIDAYIDGLEDQYFAAIDQFLAREGARYGVYAERPTITRLGPRVGAVPPEPPAGAISRLDAILLSLKLRWWAFRNTPDAYADDRGVHLFVLFHDAAQAPQLRHSLGYQKGLFGIVHAYAHPGLAARNNIIIAHELLHTVGASDKYDAAAEPRFPEGYAEPGRVPRYPQRRAEIMAVRIPLSPTESRMPEHLHGVVVGPETAGEINWLGG